MAAQPDGIGSLESILGLLLSLKISGSEDQAFSSRPNWLPPLPRKRMCLPLVPSLGGGDNRLRVRGRGQFRRQERKLGTLGIV
jgi:hypothetical protein